MRTATLTAPTTTPALGIAPTPRGFPGLPCLYCNDAGTIRVDLADLTAEDAFHCTACDAEFGLADVRAKLAAWQPVLAWIELAPLAG
jgi:hypothetical protein